MISESHVKGYYYELAQFDYDGDFEVFPMIYAQKVNNIVEVSVYPNPTTNGLVSVHTADNVNSIYLLDCIGKVIQKFDVSAVSSLIELEISDVLPGNYFLKIHAGDQSITKKLLIK